MKFIVDHQLPSALARWLAARMPSPPAPANESVAVAMPMR